jgi:hypothetical protein
MLWMEMTGQLQVMASLLLVRSEYGRLGRARANLDAVEKSWVPNNSSSGLQTDCAIPPVPILALPGEYYEVLVTQFSEFFMFLYCLTHIRDKFLQCVCVWIFIIWLMPVI